MKCRLQIIPLRHVFEIKRHHVLFQKHALTLLLLGLAWCLAGCGKARPANDQNLVAKISVYMTIKVPLVHFRGRMGRFPTTKEGLTALVQCPSGLEGRWDGPYFADGRVPVDPWGRTYQYRCPGVHNPKGYDLWSLGPSGVGGDDEIGNWKE
jgi:general secretion pathway protein G